MNDTDIIIRSHINCIQPIDFQPNSVDGMVVDKVSVDEMACCPFAQALSQAKWEVKIDKMLDLNRSWHSESIHTDRKIY